MLALLGWRADFPDYSSMFEFIRFPKAGGGIWLMDDSFDALYDQVMRTVDDRKRAKLFEQLDAKAAELVSCILLPVTNNYALVHQWVKNYVMCPFVLGKMQYIDVLPNGCKSIEIETQAGRPSTVLKNTIMDIPNSSV